VSAYRLIEHLDVIEEILASGFPILVDFPLHPFLLSNEKKLSATALSDMTVTAYRLPPT
jgi:hypothetical protein